MTRSGRGFAPKSLQENVEVLATPVSKDTPSEDVEVEASKSKDPQEEADEFLRIIRKSDYKVIDQLNQTPTKISMLSLLMSSEAHRTALLKLLNAAHVNQDITVVQFDGVCNNITASCCLGFIDAELPAEGPSHNKVLHISMKCQDNIIARVLVDTGSSLNVVPKSTLVKLSLIGPVLKQSNMIVKAFDGSQRELIGEIELPMLTGPHLLNISFQVMDINSSYSCLLGRPWIHAAGAVTSTLYQKLKFIVDDKFVIVSGEEDALVTHLSSFRYIETEEGALETEFQALEIATATLMSPTPTSQGSRTSIMSWKKLKKTVESGGSPIGWGRVMVFPEKKTGHHVMGTCDGFP
jgi:hypothetical protein